MLTRGSRGRLQRDAARALQHPLEQLQLPWLCPAFFERPRLQQSRRQSATTISRSSSTSRLQPRPSTLSPKPTYDRGFATPATPTSIYRDDYIPFDISPHHTHPWQSDQALSELLPLDPNTTLKIPDQEIAPGPRNFRFNKDGFGGDIEDIHSILQAYLDVGQLDRASMAVRRLHDIYNPGDPALKEAHLAYIATVVSNIIITGDQQLSIHLWHWFNQDVRAKGVQVDATMIRLLIQASLGGNDTRKVDRNIRRYLHAAKREKVLDESIEELARYLTKEEFEHMRETSSEYFTSFQPVIEVDTIPKVMAHQQRGLGLNSLHKSLSVFGESVSDTVKEAHLAWKQERLERDTATASMERWRADHEETTKKTRNPSILQNKRVGALMWKWHQALVPLIEEELQIMNNPPTKYSSESERERLSFAPFFNYLTPEKLAAVTILNTINRMAQKSIKTGVPLAKLMNTVGKAIQDESLTEVVNHRNKQLMARKAKGAAVDSEKPLFKSDLDEWSVGVKAHVGVTLLFLLFRAARVDKELIGDDAPAFSNDQEYVEGRKVGMIRIHDRIAELLSKEPASSTIAKHLPMLTKPIPWTDFRTGGYNSQPVNVVRVANEDVHAKDYIKIAARSGDMKQTFAALDVLGHTPWRINRALFDVMLQAWNSGEAVANLAPSKPDLEYPPEPIDPTDLKAKRLHAYQCRQVDNARDGMHSNRCFQNFQLEVARAFVNDTFYFPHNMDFRGRAYPIPPYLNHMGADHCRGLLMFGVGKPLGEKGLAWLRVHLANVFGYDKASIVEREDFSKQHWTEICDSVNNPLDGQRWWLQAEDPWQCLAACMELKNALNSPDPTKYVSYLPIHQDGTCNGLQHYAALGGDAEGAKQVNLEPGSRPADVYTAVADLVTKSVRKDAEDGVALAQSLDGKIKRKVVKQTVMTNVYGVTFVGARTQIQNRLQELYPDLFKDSQGLHAAGYLARKTFNALSAMFGGAHDIQYWLGECASRICDSLSPSQIALLEGEAAGTPIKDSRFKKSARPSQKLSDEIKRFKASVIWTTPLKMPVVQPYRKQSTKQITTSLQKITIAQPSMSDATSKRRQLQGFPPNFIHSLDATHMFLSALKCNELGLSFAAVHDSFWTHAGDIDTMNHVLRDAFIRMHSENIIGRLAAELEARYKGYMYLASVEKDSEAGKQIIALRTKGRRGVTQGKGSIKELLFERQRSNLLASDEPELRAQGQAIITPAKLYEGLIAKGKTSSIIDDTEVVMDETEDQGEVAVDASPSSIVEVALEPNTTTPKKKRAPKPKVFFWKEMSFPTIPQKGDFDVARLKESTYFFS